MSGASPSMSLMDAAGQSGAPGHGPWLRIEFRGADGHMGGRPHD
jgi:hypothetical protein